MTFHERCGLSPVPIALAVRVAVESRSPDPRLRNQIIGLWPVAGLGTKYWVRLFHLGNDVGPVYNTFYFGALGISQSPMIYRRRDSLLGYRQAARWARQRRRLGLDVLRYHKAS
ncbi:hypothetical protein Salat_2427000 [Sesamum alatum]|uniref:Uncharacterized protein n=1 Tax=Sesamum alatum TaxID=300844 RepID=A0AAE2CFD8_9LAMI|nr:hypothetical protein Salat_2427000 [Sesamum alatum]